jgi:hypothetical protein
MRSINQQKGALGAVSDVLRLSHKTIHNEISLARLLNTMLVYCFVFVYMLLASHLVYPAFHFISICILSVFLFDSNLYMLGTFVFPLRKSAEKFDCDREIAISHHTHRSSNRLSISFLLTPYLLSSWLLTTKSSLHSTLTRRLWRNSIWKAWERPTVCAS